jgi:hypothetical protein
MKFVAPQWYNTRVNGDVIQAIVVTILPVVVIWRGMRRMRAGDLDRWSARFGVVVSEGRREFVIATLERGRRIRFAGAAAGMIVGVLPAYVNLIEAERASDFAGPITGLAWVYGAALGTTLAEILIVQRPSDRRAILEARRWGDYVPSSPVVWTAVATVGGIIGAIIAVARDTYRAEEAVMAAVACLVAGACLAAGLARIVDRARLVTVGPDRDLDEAMRADGAHRVAGAAIAMAGTGAAVAMSEAVWEVFPPIALVLMAASWAALWWWWSLSTTAPWSVTEPRRVPT